MQISKVDLNLDQGDFSPASVQISQIATFRSFWSVYDRKPFYLKVTDPTPRADRNRPLETWILRKSGSNYPCSTIHNVSHKVGDILHSQEVCHCKPQAFLLFIDNHLRLPVKQPSDTCVSSLTQKDCNFDLLGKWSCI